jgi:hypothetical protein
MYNNTKTNLLSAPSATPLARLYELCESCSSLDAAYVFQKSGEHFHLIPKEYTSELEIGKNLTVEDAFILMARHKVNLTTPDAFAPKTITVAMGFTFVLPLIAKILSKPGFTFSVQGIAAILPLILVYCVLMYPAIYNFMNWCRPEVYIKFETGDLLKQGLKYFLIITSSLVGLATGQVVDLAPVYTSMIAAGTLTTMETLLANVGGNFKKWIREPKKILSAILDFILTSVANFGFVQFFTMLQGFLQGFFIANGISTWWILVCNAVYVVTYSYTLGKLMGQTIAELQRYFLSKEDDGRYGYVCSSPLWQCLPSSIQGCVAYAGRLLPDFTRVEILRECLVYCGSDSGIAEERSPLVTSQPVTTQPRVN